MQGLKEAWGEDKWDEVEVFEPGSRSGGLGGKETGVGKSRGLLYITSRCGRCQVSGYHGG